MIQMPRRSITRFFIPLVDVMMLMFSIFLLMPVMQAGGLTSADVSRMTRQELIEMNQNMQGQLKEYFEVKRNYVKLEKETTKLRKENRRLQRYANLQNQTEKLRSEIDRLRQEKAETLSKRLFIRVLEIDPKNGKLVYYESPGPNRILQRKVIETGAQARALVRADRMRPEAKNRELYYLFLFPRVDSPYPEERQFRMYKNWFNDVASGTDLSTKLATP